MDLLWQTDLEAGIDEAGRGCLCGPVVAAAVILPPDPVPELVAILNDSKKMTAKRRALAKPLIEKHALAIGVSYQDRHVIDKINIRNATFKAMNEAVQQLRVNPSKLLIDGNAFKNQTEFPYECIVKGDGKMFSIAAASVMAKESRDELMVELCDEYPILDEVYGIKGHKGYSTPKHMQTIRDNGYTLFHRKTFKPCKEEGVEQINELQ